MCYVILSIKWLLIDWLSSIYWILRRCWSGVQRLSNELRLWRTSHWGWWHYRQISRHQKFHFAGTSAFSLLCDLFLCAFSALTLLVGRQEGWGAGVVFSLEQGADLHMAQLMPLPLTVSCFSKIQIGFTFLVQARPGSPGQRAVKPMCVCVCVRVTYFCRNEVVLL